MNHINEDAVIFYYKEDTTIKNSFKVWYIYEDKKIKYVVKIITIQITNLILNSHSTRFFLNPPTKAISI